MSWKGVAAIVLAAGPDLPAAARAADPGRWTLTGTTTLPLVYDQGVTADAARNLYFDGVYVGLYRTTPAFEETVRSAVPGAGGDSGSPRVRLLKRSLLTRRGRRVLRAHRGRLRLTVRATVREPSGTVTHRTARVRLR